MLRIAPRLESRLHEPIARLATAPGEEARIDFGCVGKKLDRQAGNARKARSFTMTLGVSLSVPPCKNASHPFAEGTMGGELDEVQTRRGDSLACSG